VPLRASPVLFLYSQTTPIPTYRYVCVHMYIHTYIHTYHVCVCVCVCVYAAGAWIHQHIYID
jgi:hypothetical protein